MNNPLKNKMFLNILIIGIWIIANTLLTMNHEMKHVHIISQYDCTSKPHSGIVFGYTEMICVNNEEFDVAQKASLTIDNKYEYYEIYSYRLVITFLLLLWMFRVNNKA